MERLVIIVVPAAASCIVIFVILKVFVIYVRFWGRIAKVRAWNSSCWYSIWLLGLSDCHDQRGMVCDLMPTFFECLGLRRFHVGFI